jgi:hypothetical protein
MTKMISMSCLEADRWQGTFRVENILRLWTVGGNITRQHYSICVPTAPAPVLPRYFVVAPYAVASESNKQEHGHRVC